jgi:hypothetical protein
MVEWLTTWGRKQKRKGTPEMVTFPVEMSSEITAARRHAIEQGFPALLRLPVSPNQLMKWGLLTEAVRAIPPQTPADSRG